MTDDELRAALEAVMATPLCPHCGALTGLVVPRGGALAIPLTIHTDDCAETATSYPNVRLLRLDLIT